MKKHSRGSFVLKGKAVVGQSGGCTAVINQSLAGVLDAARGCKAVTHLWGALHGIKGLLNGEFTDLRKSGSAFLHTVRGLPSAALGSARHRLGINDEFRVLDNLRKWGVRYLFMIGGNDTAETVLRISKAAEERDYELRVVHIPKTIDNDLQETDHSPGYGSVARYAAIATQEAGLDTRAMRHVDPVKIIELMGRNSGWIVAASALLKKSEADPPHLLLLPEAPFSEGTFLAEVEKILGRTGYCVAVISETIRDAAGKRIGSRTEGITKDPFGHPYVEGAADCLARLVEARLKVRARFDKPGTLQRMSIPYVSRVDQAEAYRAGVEAVRWALRGVSGVMVALERRPGRKYRIAFRPVPVEKIPNRERYLPSSFLNRTKTGVTEAFSEYALPLLGGGLPDFPALDFDRVRL